MDRLTRRRRRHRARADRERIESMLFAWHTLKHVKSNGILFADGTETVGVGMGQVSRVDAVRLAAMKAEEHAEGKGPDGAVMASDAFFPFPDGIEEAADAGIEAVIQPGGSKNDERSSRPRTNTTSRWCSPVSGRSDTTERNEGVSEPRWASAARHGWFRHD